MGATIFLIFGFVMFVGAVYFYVKSEESTATSAKETASMALSVSRVNEVRLGELRAELKEGDEAFKRLMETLLERDAHGEKLKQKLEWVEMKLNNLPRTTKVEPLIVKQTEPLKVHVIYREAIKRVPQKTKPMTAKSRKAIVKKVKKQIKELSH